MKGFNTKRLHRRLINLELVQILIRVNESFCSFTVTGNIQLTKLLFSFGQDMRAS